MVAAIGCAKKMPSRRRLTCWTANRQVPKKKSPLGGRVRPGTILLARASEIKSDTRCPLLKQGESYRLAIGEYEDESFYLARLTMKSTEAAEQIKTISDGFRALVSLKHGSDSDMMELLDALNVISKGASAY